MLQPILPTERRRVPRFFGRLGPLLGLGALGWALLRARRIARLRARSAERYRLAARSASDAVYEWEPTGDAVSWYDAPGDWALPAGRSAWREALHPDDRDQVLAAVQRTLAHGEPFAEEYRLATGDGTWAVWRDHAVVSRDAAGFARRWVGTVVDITDRAISDQRHRARHRMAAVGRIAAGVAHEVNNMTTVILGLGELLGRSLASDHPGRSDLAEIQRAAGRVADLTRQLLAYSRQQMLQPTPVDLNQLIRDLEPLIRRTAGERVDVVLSLTGAQPRILADGSQIEQALLNLVLNAHDAMLHGGLLSLETELAELGPEAGRRHPGIEVTPGRYVRLTVSDTGVGMPPEIRARAFDPFFTTKPQGEAQGMGLATSYGIVKQSGGYIWVYSEPGQGTAFHIYLPLVEASQPPESAVPRVRPGAETVLLVDDESVLRRMAERVLRSYGYTVRTAGSGNEAIERLAATGEPVHLLVTDAVLPDTTGAELVARARRMAPELAVLGVSGYTAGDVVRRKLLPGGPFLQKPFTPEELARAVREALDRSAVAAARSEPTA